VNDFVPWDSHPPSWSPFSFCCFCAEPTQYVVWEATGRYFDDTNQCWRLGHYVWLYRFVIPENPDNKGNVHICSQLSTHNYRPTNGLYRWRRLLCDSYYGYQRFPDSSQNVELPFGNFEFDHVLRTQHSNCTLPNDSSNGRSRVG